jgi:drug/metabolite transporter (DMT)-like permease
LSVLQLAGIALILVGVWLVAREMQVNASG